MARIRSIKPEFFRHEVLFDAEKATKLPLRLAYIGLWTVSDREGRFKWRPRDLKLDCLPYDNCDFGDVLDALAKHGFVIKYEVEGNLFGCIPSWHDHQKPNQRESLSNIPEYNLAHARTCMHVQESGEGKGREKELEGKGKGKDASLSRFSEFWAVYPQHRRIDRKDCDAVWKKKGLDSQADIIIAAVHQWAESDGWKSDGGKFIPNAVNFLNKERWMDVDAAKASAPSKPKTVLTQYQDEAMQRLKETFGYADKPTEKEMKDVTPQQN